jgi:hypothetical protein
MSKMAKMACTEYVSLFQAVFERPVRSVDTPQSAVFLFWASLALFGVLSTLCTPLATHARDELGISEETVAQPVTAAMASAASFSLGAALPLFVAFIAPNPVLAIAVAAASVIFLGLLGAAGAKIGGAGILKGTVRVTFWGILAMAVTAGVGHFVG